MRKHVDNSTGELTAITLTTSEWQRFNRGKNTSRDRGRCYERTRCDVRGNVRVRAIVVPDQSPEAGPKGDR